MRLGALVVALACAVACGKKKPDPMATYIRRDVKPLIAAFASAMNGLERAKDLDLTDERLHQAVVRAVVILDGMLTDLRALRSAAPDVRALDDELVAATAEYDRALHEIDRAISSRPPDAAGWRAGTDHLHAAQTKMLAMGKKVDAIEKALGP